MTTLPESAREVEEPIFTGRGLAGRHTARAMVAAGIVSNMIVAFLFLLAPNVSHGFESEGVTIVQWFVPGVGIAMNIFGLAWMIRIYRASPESHHSWFRSQR